jgi:hypothetical protein
MSIRIKNWSKHQHFKDRTPPWIKLYREILDDPDWHDLPGDDAKMLVNLWLIASEDETKTGTLPDLRKLAFRLRIKESQLNQGLARLKQWLVHDDIDVISDGYQDDAPETETETETKGEIETHKPRKRSATTQIEKPEDVEQQVWIDWLTLRKAKRLPLTVTAWADTQREGEKVGLTPGQTVACAVQNNWAGFKAKWYTNIEKPAVTTFAQQAADIARTTVPSRTDRDPALVRMEADRLKAVPPSLEVLERMARLRAGA